jgi:hypothetical protein
MAPERSVNRLAAALSRLNILNSLKEETCMARMTKDATVRVTEVMSGWGRVRPRKPFYGMTLEQFGIRVKPFLDALAEIADLELRMQHAIAKRDLASVEAMELVQGVISAVRGDPEEREGELYCAMGYIPRNQRSTGLKRPRKEVAATGNGSGTS